jgi:hypothetical protein
VTVDAATDDGLSQTRVKVPLLLPHEMFAAMHSEGPACWQKHVVGSSPREFWEEATKAEWMADHPLLGNPHRAEPGAVPCDRVAWDSLIPIGIHGDGAKFSKYDSLMCLTWSSILSSAKDAIDNRWLITAVPLPRLLPGTLRQICEPIAWSLAVMADGIWPQTDHQSQAWPPGSSRNRQGPLANGVKGVLFDCRGDWAHQVSFWQFPTWTSTPHMCFHCFATHRGDTSWANFGPDAAWRARQRTTEEYIADHPPGVLNPLARVPGWKVEMVRWDPTHILNLGIGRWTAGAAIINLCERGIFDELGEDKRLKVAWRRFKAWCFNRRVESNARAFTLQRLTWNTTEFAESTSKAMNTRIIIGWLATEATNAPDADMNDQNKMLASHLFNLNELHLSMEECKTQFFDHAGEERFCTAGAAVLSTNAWLAAEAARNARMLWPLKPKHHGLSHLIMGVRKTKRNPKYFATMLDEDYLGRVVKTACKVSRLDVAGGVLFRYLIRVVRRWRGLEEPRVRKRIGFGRRCHLRTVRRTL